MACKAFAAYKSVQAKWHKNFTVKNSGLCINSKFHYLGASPDGITNCDCHGKGLLETKCPFNFKTGLKNYNKSKNCPILHNNIMDTKHEYYFQAQLQMLVTETNHCDFFVWTERKKTGQCVTHSC